MKFILNILTISCLYIATVWAQGVQIGSPLPGATLEFDSTFTFQLIRPDFIDTEIEVGIAVGLVSCPLSVCPLPEGELEEILYTGPFNPTLHGIGRFYENFTLTVPSEGNRTSRPISSLGRDQPNWLSCALFDWGGTSPNFYNQQHRCEFGELNTMR
ncbi:hypothetical protein K438DRAFT_1884949 [Mycena galopus ATCC 62051]|nr:hypothetical protein K438DRAFT_1884949 [Mycena galopus ATCC 62051]